MASELVRTVWCDVHADERRPVSEAGTEVKLAVGNLAGVVDLCDECIGVHVAPLAEFIEAYARRDRTAAAPVTVGGRVSCPFCEKSYSHGSSLNAHTRKAHGVSSGGLGVRGGSPGACPHCGRATASTAGLSMHVKSSHPDKWRGTLAQSL